MTKRRGFTFRTPLPELCFARSTLPRKLRLGRVRLVVRIPSSTPARRSWEGLKTSV